ncbi:hypothetical protein BHM03_00022359 [Ensete ventricosum]|nr:hypothetical protein BHM03_00022359 [Ensete ventricosum]
MLREIHHGGGTRSNVSEACKSAELYLCEEKSIMAKAQDQKCPGHISYKNPIHMKISLP